VNALGKEITTGNFHPLMKVRTEFRRLLLEMGFEEMPTNKFVESSFWNFDTLFQPQQHPARDAHDTFFLSKPKESKVELPEYWERVKKMHEEGDDKSIGWRYNWSFDEAKTNIFRTHTTAISSRMLYKMAQEGFRPMKLFSIDRVFRNETLDSTHLAEFHQIEGSVCGKGLGLNHLKGIIKAFFNKIGITKMSFKPAYNPYTEPSMEIFVYHPQLGKTIEIGNSGVFRPEMLKPMGLPDDVTVIAWGLSLERPTMLNYKLDNIRELMGDGINIKDHRKNTAYCLNPATM
jgi:phenylalanyl-tRNA synthetase alpha chain